MMLSLFQAVIMAVLVLSLVLLALASVNSNNILSHSLNTGPINLNLSGNVKNADANKSQTESPADAATKISGRGHIINIGSKIGSIRNRYYFNSKSRGNMNTSSGSQSSEADQQQSSKYSTKVGAQSTQISTSTQRSLYNYN